MSSHLPYPGRYESHHSWMRRCDKWESNRRSWDRMRGGLSGKPDYYGYADYKIDDICELPNGQKVPVIRYAWGAKYSHRLELWARNNFLSFYHIKIGQGMTARYDCVVYKNPIINDIYSNDDH
jgi:hypothetical protein